MCVCVCVYALQPGLRALVYNGKLFRLAGADRWQVCVCVFVCACVRARARARVCVCACVRARARVCV